MYITISHNFGNFLYFFLATQTYPESKLEEDLFRGYNKNIRPAANADDPVYTLLAFNLGRIESLV